MTNEVKVRFWGVRGSIAAPLTAADVKEKQIRAIRAFKAQGNDGRMDLGSVSEEEIVNSLAQTEVPTYGGNTSCVAVQYGDQIIILDMGTGLRPLGNSLIPETFKKSGLEASFILSHVHWDHIQGLPFFAELHFKEELLGLKNRWHFIGGTGWQKTAEECLAGQMAYPLFPVTWTEIQKTTYQMTFDDMHDGKKMQIGTSGVLCRFRKLFHPQETYGTRLEFPNEQVVAYTTDNEPFDPLCPVEPLLWLAKNANIWITDCQYTKEQYEGRKEAGGVPRHGWGHSYPEAVAKTAVMAEVDTVVLFHHDPGSSDEKIAQMVVHTQNLVNEMGGTSKVIGAWEGLELSL